MPDPNTTLARIQREHPAEAELIVGAAMAAMLGGGMGRMLGHQIHVRELVEEGFHERPRPSNTSHMSEPRPPRFVKAWRKNRPVSETVVGDHIQAPDADSTNQRWSNTVYGVVKSIKPHPTRPGHLLKIQTSSIVRKIRVTGSVQLWDGKSEVEA